MKMQTAIVVFLIIFAGVCLIAYLSLWNAIDDIKNSLDFVKRMCNNACEIKQSEHVLHKLISESHKDLLTEIACLATKNNEDIKRMGGKFEEWDLIELDENEVLIYSAKPNANGQMVFNCVDKAGKMYTFFGSDKLNDAKFLRHTSSPFDEREV